MQSEDNPLDYRITINDVGEIVMQHKPNGDCTHLVGGYCEVRNHAPSVCRAFECVHEAGQDSDIGRAGARIKLGLPGE